MEVPYWSRSTGQNSPPYRMGYVKQRGSTAMKITENNFKSVKEQFLLDVQTAVENEDIPSN